MQNCWLRSGYDVYILVQQNFNRWNTDPEIHKTDEDYTLHELMRYSNKLERARLSKTKNAQKLIFVCKETYMT